MLGMRRGEVGDSIVGDEVSSADRETSVWVETDDEVGCIDESAVGARFVGDLGVLGGLSGSSKEDMLADAT
jgi:hypothetical protein